MEPLALYILFNYINTMFSIIRVCRKYLLPIPAAAALFTIVCATPFLSSCSQKRTKTEQNDGTVRITATFYPLYIMLLNITDGVPDVQLAQLAPPNTGCLHDYQLTTRDMKAVESCDILVANGAGMEDFLDKVVSLKKDALIVAAQGFPLVDGNAHVWVSPAGALYEVKSIAAGLERINPQNAALYRNNAALYGAKIEALSKEMHKALDPFAGTKVITFHEAFPYFTAEFHLDAVAVIERDAGTEPSARELSSLVTLIKQTGKKVALFAEPQYPAGAADILSKETGLRVRELDPAVTGPLEKNAYLDTMNKNKTVLVETLGALSSAGGAQ